MLLRDEDICLIDSACSVWMHILWFYEMMIDARMMRVSISMKVFL